MQTHCIFIFIYFIFFSGLYESFSNVGRGLDARENMDQVRANAFFEHYTSPGCKNDERMSFGRLLFVVMFVEAILRKMQRDESLMTYLECLELYCLAVPDPIMSIEELGVFLDLALGRRSAGFENFKSHLGDLFKACYPAMYLTSHPRSLEHISRCKVRESLRGKVLPFAVDLIAPNDYRAMYVKRFLLCEKD